jgi:hypothetical protein
MLNEDCLKMVLHISPVRTRSATREYERSGCLIGVRGMLICSRIATAELAQRRKPRPGSGRIHGTYKGQ